MHNCAGWVKNFYYLTMIKDGIIRIQIPVRDDPLETAGLFFYKELNKILFKKS